MKLLSVFLILISLPSWAETLSGTAKTPKGEIVYRETHEIARDSGGKTRQIKTTYYSPLGTPIAQLKSDFTKDPYLPDSEFVDHRFKTKVIGKWDSEKRYQIREWTSEGKEKSTLLKVAPDMVSGQGFDNFIQARLFSEGQSASSVLFVVMPRHSEYAFSINKGRKSTTTEEHFEIKPEGMILRIFVKSIELYYDKNSRRLKKYVGLSNLVSDKNESQIVEITYD